MEKNDVLSLGFKEKAVDFYFLNSRKIYSSLGAFIAFSIACIVYFSAGPTETQINQAKALFEEWKAAPSNEALYQKMQTAIKKIPGLEQNFEAEITQCLLANGKANSAESLARNCLSRLQKESPLHAAFGFASFLIEKKEYQKALEASVSLKEEMEKAKTIDSSLYAYNLLRIALLQKQVCNAPGELSAWEELKSLMETNQSNLSAKSLKSNFEEKNFSLEDFISQRERIILR